MTAKMHIEPLSLFSVLPTAYLECVKARDKGLHEVQFQKQREEKERHDRCRLLFWTRSTRCREVQETGSCSTSCSSCRWRAQGRGSSAPATCWTSPHASPPSKQPPIDPHACSSPLTPERSFAISSSNDCPGNQKKEEEKE